MSVTYKSLIGVDFQNAIKKVVEKERNAFDSFKLLKWVKKMESYVKDISEFYNQLLLKNPQLDPLKDEEFLKLLENECDLEKLSPNLLDGIDLNLKEAAALEPVFKDLQ